MAPLSTPGGPQRPLVYRRLRTTASIPDLTVSHLEEHGLRPQSQTVFCLSSVACRQCFGTSGARQTHSPTNLFKNQNQSKTKNPRPSNHLYASKPSRFTKPYPAELRNGVSTTTRSTSDFSPVLITDKKVTKLWIGALFTRFCSVFNGNLKTLCLTATEVLFLKPQWTSTKLCSMLGRMLGCGY